MRIEHRSRATEDPTQIKEHSRIRFFPTDGNRDDWIEVRADKNGVYVYTSFQLSITPESGNTIRINVVDLD